MKIGGLRIMKNNLFVVHNQSSNSNRILYTPSIFAKTSLLHLQEIGILRALSPHVSERSGLVSYLFFTVLDGSGNVNYNGNNYELSKGDCVFLDCRKLYSHRTGYNVNDKLITQPRHNLWSLQWCHFYGFNMPDIYNKYIDRGGQTVFNPSNVNLYTDILTELYEIASSQDYVRDMRINQSLSTLITLLMEESWPPYERNISIKKLELQAIKNYLDENYNRHIVLDTLASSFFINKYYLTKIFKEQYGVSITVYLSQKRVTVAKSMLRFTNKSIESIAIDVGMEANYFSRSFKKFEGITPGEYRKIWY